MNNIEDLADEEIEEMVSILKGIQKHQREVSSLVARAKILCPTILNTNFTNGLYNNPFQALQQFICYGLYHDNEQTIKQETLKLKERLQQRKERQEL